MAGSTNKGNAMFDFVSIGMKEASQANFPPDIQALPLLKIWQSMPQIHPLNNRGTDIGDVKCEVVDANHVKMILRLPQPDDLWYGIFYGNACRFMPPGKRFTVYYDPDTLRRDQGGAVTIIHIKWE